jgi:hypothetical protein
VGNSRKTGNTLIRTIEVLDSRLPPGWEAALAKNIGRDLGVDAILKIQGPGRATGLLVVQVKDRLEPKDVDFLPPLRPGSTPPALISAPFLSRRTRERLKDRGFAYADLTGNVWLVLSKPGLFIDASGAQENPEPVTRARKSLKGAKAGRLIRALCDFRPPLGVRELAKRADIDPGYASKVIDFLDREALVARTSRGPITSVDWPALVRRWSQEYSPFRRGGATMFLAPRGISAVIDRLKSIGARYAVTGSWAASQIAPIAPARLLMIYVDKPASIHGELDLRPAEAGANVALLTPFDDVVYDRTSQTSGITVAAVSQVAADLSTSPGRGPNEAEALMDWMRDNEEIWRV